MNDVYFLLFGSTCFGLSQIHHQEHDLVNCIKLWYVRAGESSCCTQQLDSPAMRYTVYEMMLLMVDW